MQTKEEQQANLEYWGCCDEDPVEVLFKLIERELEGSEEEPNKLKN